MNQRVISLLRTVRNSMKLKNKFYIALVSTILMSVIYYLIYSYIELNQTDWCKKYICINLPSYEDVFAIWVAIVGLYFIVTSLEEWKGQYKFERSQQTFKKVTELSLGLDRLIGDAYVLINESERLGHLHAYNAYEEKLKINKLSVKIYLLQLDVFEGRNHYKQKDFEEITNFMSNFESGLTGGLRDLHWNDCSQPIKNSEDAENILNEYRKKIMVIKKMLNKLKKDLYI